MSLEAEKLVEELPPKRWRRLFDRNISVIRTVEFGLALGCIWAAWTAGGDMWLVIPALILGFCFAAVGIAMVPGLSNIRKFAWKSAVALVYVGIGGFLYWHFIPKAEPKADKPIVDQVATKPDSLTSPLSEDTGILVEQPSLLS